MAILSHGNEGEKIQLKISKSFVFLVRLELGGTEEGHLGTWDVYVMRIQGGGAKALYVTIFVQNEKWVSTHEYRRKVKGITFNHVGPPSTCPRIERMSELKRKTVKSTCQRSLGH